MTCPNCQSTNWIIQDDNGAEYPSIRVEFCKCNQCGHRFKNVLTA